jgi:hypothetical protein
VIAVGVERFDDDIFFVIGDTILPSRPDIRENTPPIVYTSDISLDVAQLRDSDPYTSIEIDPYALSRGDISYTFDLARVYPRDTLSATIGYHTRSKMTASVSVDFRFVRVTFARQERQSDVTIFHTLTFTPRVQSRYLVSSPG